MEHKHAHVEHLGRCHCGTQLCGSLSPFADYGCNLKKGHSGPCANTHCEPVITWKRNQMEALIEGIMTQEEPLSEAH